MSATPVQDGLVFCIACGNQLISTAVICPKCGTPRAYLDRTSSSISVQGSKSRRIAVWLAVFLSAWTWVYSFKRDAPKFAIAMALQLLGIVSTAITYLDISGSIPAWADTSNSRFLPWLWQESMFSSPWQVVLNGFIPAVIWIWAIVSASLKPKRFD